MRRVKYIEHLWFAIGYHDGAMGVEKLPSQTLIDYIQNESKINILDLYKLGYKAGCEVEEFNIKNNNGNEEQ